ETFADRRPRVPAAPAARLSLAFETCRYGTSGLASSRRAWPQSPRAASLRSPLLKQSPPTTLRLDSPSRAHHPTSRSTGTAVHSGTVTAGTPPPALPSPPPKLRPPASPHPGERSSPI